MEGYLLDTNHFIPLLRDGHPHREQILGRLAALPADSPVFMATATLAELEVGCCFRSAGREAAQAEVREVIRANGVNIIDFTKHTAAEYGPLKASLMQKYHRRGAKNRAKWPEAWVHPDTGVTLGADEFDLLLASHALERKLVIVTTDDMSRIRAGIGLPDRELPVEDWTGYADSD